MKKGPVAFLSPNENQFWRELIEKYLYPLDEDKTEKVICVSVLLVTFMMKFVTVKLSEKCSIYNV